MRLVKRVEGDYFVISPYLHNFAFEEKKNTKLLDCSIIIETNFKVYVLIPKAENPLNYELISRILAKLINIEHKDYQLQELILGEITQEAMKSLFYEKITVQDYLSFFIDYMSPDLQIEKDLGTSHPMQANGIKSSFWALKDLKTKRSSPTTSSRNSNSGRLSSTPEIPLSTSTTTLVSTTPTTYNDPPSSVFISFHLKSEFNKLTQCKLSEIKNLR